MRIKEIQEHIRLVCPLKTSLVYLNEIHKWTRHVKFEEMEKSPIGTLLYKYEQKAYKFQLI